MSARGRPSAYPGSEAALAAALVAFLLVAGWLWLAGQVAGWISSGSWPRVGLAQALSTAVRLPARLGDPRTAWPGASRASMPGAALLDGCILSVGLLLGSTGLVAWRLLRRLPATHRSGGASRRPTGARWARPPDLRSLRVRRLGRARLALGHAGRSRALLATESSHSVLVIGPTQSGKTTALAVPALLEWKGPVIATSVKDDLASATLGWRSRRGPCWIFDPTRSSGLGPLSGWSPLAGCPDWSAAQRLASWFVDATPARTGMADAAFWFAAAAKQLAPLLLAAERGGMSMADVVRWTNTNAYEEPLGLLELAGEPDAATALAACAARDPRILSSVSTTLETVLSPFEDPLVEASTSDPDIDLDALIATSGTLYLCGPAHEQHRVQGLFAALVSSTVFAATARVGRSGRPLDPPLLVVLDEAANIAPVRDLDTLASTGAGMGVQLVTICQDLSQLAARYGQERARTIANNHRAKVLLSGVSDLSTLDLVSGLAGEQAVREETVTHDLGQGRRSTSQAVAFRRLAPSDLLRRIPPNQGVLVYGHLPPAWLRLRPWYLNRELCRRVGADLLDLPRPARRHAGWFTRHLRIDGRPGGVE